MHHFQTQTCTVLFPFSPPLFKERLVSTAFDTPHLLFALLAASCSHHARLAYGSLSEVEKTTLEFTNLAVVGLRAAMNDANELHSVETAMTAMTLCTNDICDGNLQSWRLHLTGVKELLSTFFRKQQDSMRRSDPFAIFLAKWFATLDTSAGISGLDNHAVSNGQYWSINAKKHNAGAVDDFCGYSLELMPILARLGTLARSQQPRTSVSSDRSLTDASLSPDVNVWDEARMIEAEILCLSNMFASEPTSCLEKGCTEESRSTHQAFIYAALLYLHRRIQLLPKDHPVVREDIAGVINAVEEIKSFSTANILILWPLFSAGCDTDDPWERSFIQTRMDNMRTLGMGNFTRAKELMHQYWNSGSHLRWDVYFALSGTSLVLF
ncbi:uncharacterized protein K452DRAFT_311332 [Aplosporella prunicola CBS 121167]|uniref:Fungal-specific transcription factor domain-containing protein n=1 Tax=Aplosporella prunicola CBS 121167 TaxID=1176127 RepID=A0A6A6B7W4_9PEZI|nr:uncharacterized protein K452DRAFT_311332 [Aplosporella prunicola CBS 121167]KAF2138881.1 hypothetical protein K452DRAFT_311332 [Aplosporella prunicola CBS 121167]